jgi:hypothetical protein
MTLWNVQMQVGKVVVQTQYLILLWFCDCGGQLKRVYVPFPAILSRETGGNEAGKDGLSDEQVSESRMAAIWRQLFDYYRDPIWQVTK